MVRIYSLSPNTPPPRKNSGCLIAAVLVGLVVTGDRHFNDFRLVHEAVRRVEHLYLRDLAEIKAYINTTKGLTEQQKSTLLEIIRSKNFLRRLVMSTDPREIRNLNTLIGQVEKFNQALDAFVEAELLTEADAQNMKAHWSLVSGESVMNVISVIQRAAEPNGPLSNAEVKLMLEHLGKNLSPPDIRKLTHTVNLLTGLKAHHISLSLQELNQILNSEKYMLDTLTLLASKADVVALLNSRNIKLPEILSELKAGDIGISRTYESVMGALPELRGGRLSDRE